LISVIRPYRLGRMLYTDTLFLPIFFGVCFVTWLLRPWPALKEWFLIGFSLLVIATWGYFDLGLFLAVLAVNFWAATTLAKVGHEKSRFILTTFIVIDLSTLAIFKYSNFMGSNFAAITGLAVPSFPLGIPLAISFYVFHLISYLVDIHAGRVKLATLREYLFYLSFFPHVIAGPIVRAWQLVPQIGKNRHVAADFAMGFHYLVTGFFLKSVVANNIAQGIDAVWTDQLGFSLSTLDRWLVAFLYYCQIYGDFAGYSLMALGMARLLGYRLPANFRSPMLAATVQEFWRRWHITLSKWLRDYLYIPMGGSRVSPARSALNVLVTMLLGGLWHGAGWGFIVWGAMHGGVIVGERALGFRGQRPGSFRWLFWWIITQMWVMVAWVFFRAPDLRAAVRFLWRMIPLHDPHPFVIHRVFFMSLVCAIPVIMHHGVPYLLRKLERRFLAIVLGLATGVMLTLNFVIFSPAKVFIYFRF
jgi:alginate O-acetyltransferase complex protein AlgI